jgi:uncharacterized membrane protein YdjX (TVP38/TMEM64 family)
MNNKKKNEQDVGYKSSLDEKKHSKVKVAAIFSMISALFVVATVLGVIFMWEYFSDAEQIRKAVGENYVLGAIAMIVITALQVIVAFVPGELVEIAAGLVFGTVEGAILVLIGATLGSITAILLTRKLGVRIVKTFFPDTDINSLPLLNNPKERNFLTFLLFLIPGTPKDMLTYVIGLTDMKIWQYILLTSFARIPSIISSTAGGDAFGSSKIMTAIYIFAGIAAVSLIGYVIYQNITKKKSKDQ